MCLKNKKSRLCFKSKKENGYEYIATSIGKNFVLRHRRRFVFHDNNHDDNGCYSLQMLFRNCVGFCQFEPKRKTLKEVDSDELQMFESAAHGRPPPRRRYGRQRRCRRWRRPEPAGNDRNRPAAAASFSIILEILEYNQSMNS